MAATKPVMRSELASTVSQVPSNFIRPSDDRPNREQVLFSDDFIPFIDLQDLGVPNHSDGIQKIGQALKDYSCFQIKNDGVPEAVVDKMVKVGRKVFNLPKSEGLRNYSDDPLKTPRLSTSLNVRTEKVSKWKDYLRLRCYPLDYIREWPTNPSSFRDDVAEYGRKVRELGLRVLEVVSECLGLEKDNTDKAPAKHGQHLGINYYPKCPQPELSYGLPGHADPNAITILLQEVAGLQFLKDGNWVDVNPIPNVFTVNTGDQIQLQLGRSSVINKGGDQSERGLGTVI